MFVIAAAVIVVTVSAPPLSPQEAVAVLRASQSISDRTDARSYPEPEPSVTVPSRPGDGPFGAFPAFTPSAYCCTVRHPIPGSWNRIHPYGTGRYPSRTPRVVPYVGASSRGTEWDRR